jgi:hypothetical protein
MTWLQWLAGIPVLMLVPKLVTWLIQKVQGTTGILNLPSSHLPDLTTSGTDPGITLPPWLGRDTRDSPDTAEETGTDEDEGPSGKTRGGVRLPLPEGRTVTLTDVSTDDQRQFLFRLQGNKVRGALVEAGSDFQLRFEYTGTTAQAAAVVQGQGLLDAAAHNLDLQIAIYPGELTITDAKYLDVAQFRGGALTNQVVFSLRANAAALSAGLHVFFSVNGCALYDFPLRLQVVDSLEVASSIELEPGVRRLDLDAYARATSTRAKRSVRLLFKARGSDITVTFHELDKARPVMLEDVPLVRTGDGKLTNLLKAVAQDVKDVAGQAFWNRMAAPLDAVPESDPVTRDLMRRARNQVISAGARLYQTLSKDTNLGTILELIDKLPPGSGISLFSDCGFLPLEILYPREYHHSWLDQPEASRLWGYRFRIEYFLWEAGTEHVHPPTPVQAGTPLVSLNLDPSIDTQLTRGAARLPPFLPVQHHEGLLSDRSGDGWRTEWNRDFDAIVKTVQTAHEATLLYYYCHGRADTPFADAVPKLAFGANAIDPDWVRTQQQFRHAPVIVLNSCASGEASPLSLLSFLERFRSKGAAGVVSTWFAVPMLFASELGRVLITRYADGDSLGDILYDLRRRLLEHDNPLGLFYALQCPIDLRAPLPLTNRREAA